MQKIDKNWSCKACKCSLEQAVRKQKIILRRKYKNAEAYFLERVRVEIKEYIKNIHKQEVCNDFCQQALDSNEVHNYVLDFFYCQNCKKYSYIGKYKHTKLDSGKDLELKICLKCIDKML